LLYSADVSQQRTSRSSLYWSDPKRKLSVNLSRRALVKFFIFFFFFLFGREVTFITNTQAPSPLKKQLMYCCSLRDKRVPKLKGAHELCVETKISSCYHGEKKLRFHGERNPHHRWRKKYTAMISSRLELETFSVLD